MSRVTMRQGASSSQLFDVQTLAGLGPRLLSMSVDSAREFARQAAAIVSPALAIMPAATLSQAARPSAADACCAVPEVDCPPRCVCEIAWEASPGEKLRCTVRVTNSSRTERAFQVKAVPLTGPGGAAVPFTVAPPTVTLPAGGSAVVEASVALPENLATGSYQGEILVVGAYEQWICVKLTVQGEQHCHCEVVQGDPPVRLRAHHWYDHFQCAEPCAPPRPVPGAETPHPAAGGE